ncbi:isthmin-2 isoform X1 [Dasypus novemcinctus]|uniref:isthmin-2 isoform X1 n=1 Tax=Dasypus novemcinctus TaxID=9361 RepID=UPI00265EC778|nr:isthmin-2 isoform X1 [Dasypus novemcinctus]
MPRVAGRAGLVLGVALLTALLAAGRALPLDKPRDPGPRPGSPERLAEVSASPREEEAPVPPGARPTEPAALTPGQTAAPGTLAGAPLLLGPQKLPGLANTSWSTPNPNSRVTVTVVEDPQAKVKMTLLAKPSQAPSQATPTSPPAKQISFWSNLEGEEEEWEEDYTDEYSEFDDMEANEEEYEKKLEPGFSGATGHRLSPKEETGNHGPAQTLSSPSLSSSSSSSSGITDISISDFPREGWQPQGLNATDMFNPDIDSCEKWLNCKNDFLAKYMQQMLQELPSCPCVYPPEAASSNEGVREEYRGRSFRWRDASSQREHLYVYYPTARFCLRSLLSAESGTLAAQHCCYDKDARLLTRGKGAGSPDLVSMDFSRGLHFKVDTLPWILCKGDWSRYHTVRPPNNGRACAENPSEEEYLEQLQEAKEY